MAAHIYLGGGCVAELACQRLHKSVIVNAETDYVEGMFSSIYIAVVWSCICKVTGIS